MFSLVCKRGWVYSTILGWSTLLATADLLTGCAHHAAARAAQRKTSSNSARASVECPAVNAIGADSMIDDFESAYPQLPTHEGRGGFWFQFDDHTGGQLVRRREREESSLLHITSSGFKDWGAGVGVAFRAATNSRRACAYDASVYQGVRLRARGAGRVRIVLPGIANVPVADGGRCAREKAHCYDQPGAWIDLRDAYRSIELPFCQLFPEGWGGDRSGVEPSQLVSIQMRFPAGQDVSLWLDDLEFYQTSPGASAPRCGRPCPIEAAPASARIEPGTSTVALTPELTLHTFEQATKSCGSLTRRYLTYVPAKAKASAPVIMALHGSGSNAESMQAFMTRGRLDELAARDGYVVVYPNAAPGAPTDPRPEFPNTGSWRVEAFDDEQVDDMAYLNLAIDDLKSRRVIDGSNAIYLAGISNGGGMVLKMARQQSKQFRGVASVMAYDGEPPAPVPDLRGLGMNRVLFVYSDGDPGLPKTYLKFQKSEPVQWARALGVSEAVLSHPRTTALADRVHEGLDYRGDSPLALATRDSHATQFDFSELNSETRVRAIVFDHAGHFWAHPAGEVADFAIDRWGFRNQDVDAADEVWAFFFDGRAE